MLLKDKIAVIYSAGGSIGSAVSHAFALDGDNHQSDLRLNHGLM
jgi:hypothetical protein